MRDDLNSTQLGLLRCLQALTEEASALGLGKTSAALQQATDACRAETARGPVTTPPESQESALH